MENIKLEKYLGKIEQGLVKKKVDLEQINKIKSSSYEYLSNVVKHGRATKIKILIENKSLFISHNGLEHNVDNEEHPGVGIKLMQTMTPQAQYTDRSMIIPIVINDIKDKNEDNIERLRRDQVMNEYGRD